MGMDISKLGDSGEQKSLAAVVHGVEKTQAQNSN